MVVVLFRSAEEFELAVIVADALVAGVSNPVVALGVKIDRGNVLRVDIEEDELTGIKLVDVAEPFTVRLPIDEETVDWGEVVIDGKLV